MLCSRKLFRAPNDLAVLKQIQDCNIPLPSTINPNVPQELDEIIMKLIGETPIRNRVLRDAFVQANPNSFRNSNPNYMLAGVRLRVPDAGDILELLFDMNSPTMRSANQSRENWVHFP